MEEDDYHQSSPNAGFPAGHIGGSGAGFPMTGFAGVGNAGGGKRSRDFVAFLARQGEEEEGMGCERGMTSGTPSSSFHSGSVTDAPSPPHSHDASYMLIHIVI